MAGRNTVPLAMLVASLLCAAIGTAEPGSVQIGSVQPGSTQPEATKPSVPATDFGRFESLRSPVLSPTGRAFAYISRRVDGERNLLVRRLDPDQTWTIPWGTDAVFSQTGTFVAWQVTPSKEERKKLERDEKPIRNRAELLELATGERHDLGEVAEIEFDPTGGFLAVQGVTDNEGETAVYDLHVRDLAAGSSTVFGDVESSAWHEELPLLAMITSSAGDRGNAVQVYAPATGRLVGLDHSPSKYRHLAWHEQAPDLAVLRERREEDGEPEEGEPDASEDVDSGDAETKGEGDANGDGVDTTEYELVVWRGIGDAGGHRARVSLVLASDTDGLDAELYVTGDAEPSWSPDSKRVSFGVRERPEPEPEEDGEGEESEEQGDSTTEDAVDGDAGPDDKDPGSEDLPRVQIWHSADVEVVPMQKAREKRYRERSLLAVWNVEVNRVVLVGSDLEHDAEVLPSWTYATEEDRSAYPWGNKFGRPYLDVWTVDLDSGDRSRTLEKVRHVWHSAEGRYLLWFDGEHYWSLELATGSRTNLTDRVPTRFADTDRDLPNDGLEPPFGVGGWLNDDLAVLLYDQFDVWRVAPDGSSASRLTDGFRDQTVHRVIDLDDDEETLREEDGIYFSLRNEWTEQRGFARFDQQYRRLVLDDRSFWNLQQAEHADALLYRRESRVDAPELLLTDASFAGPRQVAQSNPFLDEYAWTHAELVEYRNPEGLRLHGVLLYPANHQPGRKYPMIVYGYEILSPRLHYWLPPDEKDYYSFTVWTQRDYFVLLPDVHFRPGDPGVSMAETLSAALEAVDDLGLIDRAKVGFVGHSWGGYEATFLAARTNLFAATVAGAPLTDFVSMMGQFHWRPGLAETAHWETGQARMIVPYWEDPAGHERNSPLHGVHEMNTPILMAHGDDDGVVEFFQSTLFYNFARRAEKQMVLLVYEGEGHGFRREENSIDYHRRILEWFDHYLKGEPAPQWISEGVRWQDHEDEKRRVAGSGKP